MISGCWDTPAWADSDFRPSLARSALRWARCAAVRSVSGIFCPCVHRFETPGTEVTRWQEDFPGLTDKWLMPPTGDGIGMKTGRTVTPPVPVAA